MAALPEAPFKAPPVPALAPAVPTFAAPALALPGTASFPQASKQLAAPSNAQPRVLRFMLEDYSASSLVRLHASGIYLQIPRARAKLSFKCTVCVAGHCRREPR